MRTRAECRGASVGGETASRRGQVETAILSHDDITALGGSLWLSPKCSRLRGHQRESVVPRGRQVPGFTVANSEAIRRATFRIASGRPSYISSLADPSSQFARTILSP